jgi:hypothetical protein
VLRSESENIGVLSNVAAALSFAEACRLDSHYESRLLQQAELLSEAHREVRHQS